MVLLKTGRSEQIVDGVAGSLNQIREYVQEHSHQFLDEFSALVRQPSVSLTGVGVSDCADMVSMMAERAGFRTEVVPTERYPRVIGELTVDAQLPTLLITSHYDVQPVDPLSLWEYDPFLATRTGDGRIIGRSTTDAKGNLVAVLKAVETLNHTHGRLPVNVKVLFDGEEEIGSPSLPTFLETHRRRLSCDAVVTIDAGFEAVGRPFIWLGAGGILSVEMSAHTGTKEVHSDSARLVPNAIWRLIWSMATLKDRNEQVNIPGFYDRVKAPTPAEDTLLERMPWDDDLQKGSLGVEHFLLGLSGYEARRRLLYEPTCTITGVLGGYEGDGSKEAVPNQARGKVEFRLVVDQNPDEILDLLTEYLDASGFGDIGIRVLARTEPSQCSLNSDIRQALERAALDTYGLDPVVRPRHGSSGRQATWIARRLGVEGALTGIGPPNWNGHAPNEFMTVEHFLSGVCFIARTMEHFGFMTGRRMIKDE